MSTNSAVKSVLGLVTFSAAAMFATGAVAHDSKEYRPSKFGKDDKLYGSLEPGLSKEGALYLVDKGVVAVGADTWGLEAVPFEKGVGVFEVHQILLQQNGIYILETMNVEPLVKDGAYEVLFTLGASRLTGAVQAIINPIAIK